MSAGARIPTLLRAWRLITRSEAEWAVIAAEQRTPRAVLVGYVLPLCAIPALGWAVGLALFPRDIVLLDSEAARYTPAFIARAACVTFVAALGSIGAVAAVFQLLAPLFDAPRDWRAMWTVAAYGSTPMLLGGVLLARPLLVGFVLLTVVHAAALYASGLRHVALVHRNETAQFVAAALFVAMVASSAAGAALSAAGIL
jgi:hypothetical protein